MRWLAVVVIHLGASIVPLFQHGQAASVTAAAFPGWPAEFQGQALEALALTEQERGFSQGFPGRIGRFTDGSRELVIRFISRPSRKLHPATDCLKGSGYTIEPRPIHVDQQGGYWGCVLAQRGTDRFSVCERIVDSAGNGWYDVSSWFWAALLEQSEGPWWAVTVAEPL